MGIVSALGRSGFHFGGQGDSQPNYQDFIQTDAAINPGNSGGALVDAEGRLVGINTGIITSRQRRQSKASVSPCPSIWRVTSWTGSSAAARSPAVISASSCRDITPGLAESFGLPDQNGALVGDVLPGTPAQKAGIKSGDVIVEFNGKKVADVATALC